MCINHRIFDNHTVCGQENQSKLNGQKKKGGNVTIVALCDGQSMDFTLMVNMDRLSILRIKCESQKQTERNIYSDLPHRLPVRTPEV